MSADFITSRWMVNNCTGNAASDARKINEKILEELRIDMAFPWAISEIEIQMLIDHVTRTDDIGFESDDEAIRASEVMAKKLFEYLKISGQPVEIEPREYDE